MTETISPVFHGVAGYPKTQATTIRVGDLEYRILAFDFVDQVQIAVNGECCVSIDLPCEVLRVALLAHDLASAPVERPTVPPLLIDGGDADNAQGIPDLAEELA